MKDQRQKTKATANLQVVVRVSDSRHEIVSAREFAKRA